jgi:hypothetical protein
LCVSYPRRNGQVRKEKDPKINLKKKKKSIQRLTYLTTQANSFARKTCSSLKDDYKVMVTMIHDLEIKIM